MKRTIVYILAIAIVSFTSCKKVNQWLGKSSMSQAEVDALVTQNNELQKQVKEDAAAYERELEALRAEYEQKIADMQKPVVPEGGYLVVVGAFKDQNLADKYSAKIKEMGFEGNIVDGPSTFKLVTYSTHPSLNEALAALSNAKTSATERAWIYFKK